MLLGILGVGCMPGQPTFWRFPQWLHLSGEQQMANLNNRLREITQDTGTTVHTLPGKQMGARDGYRPKHRGKRSYQLMLNYFAEKREFVAGRLHNGDRPTGAEIARHLAYASSQLPKTVEKLGARADGGFYCWEAARCYQSLNCECVMVARKTSRLVAEWQAATGKSSPFTDADFESQFSNQPGWWQEEFRYVGLGYDRPEPDAANAGQMGLLEGMACSRGDFVMNIPHSAMTPAEVAKFFNKRAEVENLIQKPNNDIG